jgi:hypothetical protein
MPPKREISPAKSRITQGLEDSKGLFLILKSNRRNRKKVIAAAHYFERKFEKAIIAIIMDSPWTSAYRRVGAAGLKSPKC